MEKQKKKMPQTRMLAIGFAAMIIIGAVLLMLPIAHKGEGSVSFLDALFTSTSASCVTGLVVADTFQNWTLFGQLVILGLIQVGGLGFITIGVYIAVLFKKRIGLSQREAIHESINTIEIAGVVRLTRKIIKGTFLFEGIGAVLLAIRFVPQKGLVKGIYYSIFHAISAFCNAGFDLMGDTEAYSSLVAYESDWIVNLTIMGLIVIGGLGFIVWDDLYRNGLHFKRYLLHTKIVLSATLLLTIVPAVLFLISERNTVFVDMTVSERILGALFSAVTPRTAGFNTVDTGSLSEAGKLMTIILMFIGGSPGSTAGGIKTTTFVVMILSAIAAIRSTYGTNVFGRRLEEDTIRKAATVFTINLGLAAIAATAIMFCHELPFEDVLLEVFSAIGTVGMSAGITRELSVVPRCILILLMYCGRLGSLSFALSFARKRIIPPVQNPVEKIVVG